MQDEDTGDWNDLTEEDRSAMRALTPREVSEIDAMLLDLCAPRWQKVALILGKLLHPFEQRFPEVPYEFLSYRIQELEEQGSLEVAGDPFRPRQSEVRLRT